MLPALEAEEAVTVTSSRRRATGVGNVAAIDCGSLSTRLLVADADGSTLERRMRLSGLGVGVDTSRQISAEAAARVVAVLQEYRELLEAYQVKRTVMVGTSALRDAGNRDSFSKQAEAVVGTPLRVLSGEQEAALSFRGATRDLAPASGPWLVADIGGGSTELAAGPPLTACSLDLGCVRVSERFFLHDPPLASELRAARHWLEGCYREASAKLARVLPAATMVGLAGTVAALACFDQGLVVYKREAVHHYVLTRDAVAGALAKLAAEPALARAGLPGIEAGRAPYIVGGALVLDSLMGHFGFDSCLASESDILDGLVEELLSAEAWHRQAPS